VPLSISAQVEIPDEELEWKFIRSSGPGGQNVNKVASAVQLRFLLARNSSLPATAKSRLRRLAGQRLIDDGSILIAARAERSQEQNRRAALERLAELIRAALVEPKLRKKTRPTRASKERRIESKKLRSGTKRERSGRGWESGS
jgi:ribosome-associated protein